VQVAWWERVTIFPIEGNVERMKEDKTKENFSSKGSLETEKNWLLEERGKGVVWREMDRWMRRHAVRATLPFLAALIAVWPKVRCSG
jgi:hypothetical protein